jgi:DNA-binding response OmpR family regulator
MSQFRLKLTREGELHHLVQVAIGNSDIELVGTASGAEQAVELAERQQPDLLLVDLDRIRETSELLSRVREVAPRTKVVVVSGRDEDHLAPAVLRAGAHGYVTRTITPDRLVKELVTLVSGALGEAATALAAEPASAGRARRFVGGALDGWGRTEAGEVVDLLVSELVANAIRHSASEVEVAVHLLPRGLRVEVHDTGDGRPTLADANPDAERGRGLALVDALSAAWGVDAHADGKDVWFELDAS